MVGVAEFLVGQGVAVTYVTRLTAITPFMDLIGRTTSVMTRLLKGDFTVLTRTRLDEIRQGECIVVPTEGDRTMTIPADIVVLITPNRAERSLYDDLRKQPIADGRTLMLIGDALAPRDLQLAMREGHFAARALANAW